MTTIRCIYHGTAPDFPATDQHPDAERFYLTEGAVLTQAQWDAAVAAAEGQAKRALFGTSDDDQIAVALENNPDARAAIKHALAAAIAQRMPVAMYVIDAIGAPSFAEIDDVLNPPALPPLDPTPLEKLAAAGLTVADLRTVLGLN